MKIFNKYGLFALLCAANSGVVLGAGQDLLKLKTPKDIAAYNARLGGRGLGAGAATTILQLKDAYQAALAGDRATEAARLASARKNIGTLQAGGGAGALADLAKNVEKDIAQAIAAASVELEKKQAALKQAEEEAAAHKQEQVAQANKAQAEKEAAVQSQALAAQKEAGEKLTQAAVRFDILGQQLADKGIDIDAIVSSSLLGLINSLTGGSVVDDYLRAVYQNAYKQALGESFDDAFVKVYEQKLEMLVNVDDLLQQAFDSGLEAEQIAKTELDGVLAWIEANKSNIREQKGLAESFMADVHKLRGEYIEELLNIWALEEYPDLKSRYYSSYLSENFQVAFYAKLAELNSKLFANISRLQEAATKEVRDFREITLAPLRTVLNTLENISKSSKSNVDSYLEELKKEWGSRIKSEEGIADLAQFGVNQMALWLEKRVKAYEDKEARAWISGYYLPGSGWNEHQKRKEQLAKLSTLIKLAAAATVADAPELLTPEPEPIDVGGLRGLVGEGFGGAPAPAPVPAPAAPVPPAPKLDPFYGLPAKKDAPVSL